MVIFQFAFPPLRWLNPLKLSSEAGAGSKML
jgi:hypothetical protein